MRIVDAISRHAFVVISALRIEHVCIPLGHSLLKAYAIWNFYTRNLNTERIFAVHVYSVCAVVTQYECDGVFVTGKRSVLDAIMQKTEGVF